MRIELDLPDWADERHIRIFAGIELVAIKRCDKDFWKVKVARCIQCGECCMNLRGSFLPTDVPTDKNGTCIYLRDEPGRPGKKRCSVAINRPRNCGDDPTNCKHITHKIVPCQDHTTHS